MRLIFLILLTSCIKNPVTGKKEIKVISYETEYKIGLELKNSMIKEYGELKDEEIINFINEIGKKIASASDRKIEYSFQILNTEIVNAFALPGGFVLLTRGLLENVDSAGELAGVISHEVAHIALMHPVKTIQNSFGTSFLTILATALAAMELTGDAAIMMLKLGELFSNLFLLGYSREYEAMADKVGLEYMLKAGYNPEKLNDFFKKLKAMEAQEARIEPYLRSHPPVEKRIAYIQKFVAINTARIKLYAKEDEVDLKKIMSRIKSSVKNFRIDGRRFIDEENGLEFLIPDGWKFVSCSKVMCFSKIDSYGFYDVIKSTDIENYLEELGIKVHNSTIAYNNYGKIYFARYKGSLGEQRLAKIWVYGRAMLLISIPVTKTYSAERIEWDYIFRSVKIK